VKLDDRHGQAVNRAIAVLDHIQPRQHGQADQIDRLRQGPTTVVEPATFGQVEKQMAIRLPMLNGLGFLIPPATFRDHRQVISSLSLQAGAGPERRNNGAICCRQSSTTTYIQVQKSIKLVIIQVSSR
jgi:hypothetical protein